MQRKFRQRRALQECVSLGAGDIEKFVIADRSLFLARDQVAETGVDTQGQLARQALVLVKGFPLELPVGLVDQDRARQCQRDEEQQQRDDEAALGHASASSSR